MVGNDEFHHCCFANFQIKHKDACLLNLLWRLSHSCVSCLEVLFWLLERLCSSSELSVQRLVWWNFIKARTVSSLYMRSSTLLFPFFKHLLLNMPFVNYFKSREEITQRIVCMSKLLTKKFYYFCMQYLVKQIVYILTQKQWCFIYVRWNNR